MAEVLRERYLSELENWKDITDVTKVMTGVRRSGKSVIMRQFRDRLIDNGIEPSRILFMNFESSEFDDIRNHRDLNAYIADHIPKDVRTYVFLDEVQRIEGWERTVNSLAVDYDSDVYITGSNAYLLSSNISTFLSGRYVEIPVLPFSFKEFLQAHPMTQDIDRKARFQQFLHTGGIPLTDPDRKDMYNSMILEGIHNTVLVKDIITRLNLRNMSDIDSIARFMFDNTGKITNVDNIAKTLGISEKTASKYILALEEAYLIYKVERYDIKGKKLLRTHEKYYPVDTGLARAILDRGIGDISRPLENIVFIELKRRGYRVRVGSFRDREVDFTAEKEGKVEYFQICLTMLEDSTFEREVRSLKAIDDNYPKTVLSLDPIVRSMPDGLMHRNVIEWLLSDD